jgi:hypothetical protein
MMRDVLGPKLQLGPQPSAAMDLAGSRPKVRTTLKIMVLDVVMCCSYFKKA